MGGSQISASSPTPTGESDDLERAVLLIADAIGDVIERWGFRKVLGRMWTVLYLAGEPLSAAELAERLSLSSGSVSMALGELQEWAVVKRALRPGERREYYIAETDFWKMISKVVSERERFLVTSVRERIAEASALLRPLASRPGREALGRAKVLLSIAQTAETVIESFLASRRADFSGFGALIQLPRGSSRDKKTS
jgi:DNA-binding transcriptional regulator GbsR (MarR family)